MNYQKKTVRDINVKGKKVLLRCDFNVPQDKKTGAITSDKRIVAALPTIRYLLDQGAAVIACSHLGKPQPDFDKWVKKQTEKGKDPATLTEDAWSKEQKKLTLAPVAARLAELLGQEVIFASDVVGEDAQAKAAALQPGQVLLLENTNLVVTRETILQVVWGTDISVESRTVDMHIRTLRKKLGDAGKYICTVRKVGYKLTDSEEELEQ